MDIIGSLKNEIFKTGMTPPENFEPGRIIRFSDDGGNNKNGWCFLSINTDGSAGAAFGNWKGIDEKWFYTPDGKSFSKEQQQNLKTQIMKARQKIEQDKRKKNAEAKEKAQKIWKESNPVFDQNHAYLKNKNVPSHYLRENKKGELLVPMLDKDETIWNLERIPVKIGAKKKGLSGGKRSGLYFKINGNNEVCLCEGYSTGASIHNANGATVYCAFNAGNMLAVAKIVKRLHPNDPITIAADNDLATEKETGINPGRKAAEEAAAAIDAEICICPHDSDFNDLENAHGRNAVEVAFKKCRLISGEEWGKPVSLKEDRAPDIDPNILTGIIGDMARAVSIETETPLELAFGIILSVLATACQGKFIVQIKSGYREPLNLWMVVALGPANRKSSVLIKITKPLSQWETRKHLELEPVIRDTSSKLKNQEARIKSLRVRYGKAKQEDLRDIETEISDIENNLVQVPNYSKLWAQDVTPEHLGTLLNNHDEKMSILSAEGGIFDIIGGRYSNGVANLDLFLQGHSGDPVRVDRGSRDPVFLNGPALTLGLSPQPEVLRGLVDKPGFRGKGLLARFLYFLPKSNLGYRGLESDPVPENIKSNYQNLIYELLNIEADENESGEKQPYILNLSKEAYREWSDFYMVVEKDLREGGRFEHLKDWAGKLPGAAARIAGLLHCAKNPYQPWAQEIEVDTMENALEIAATLSGHALIAFDLMGADRSLEQARKIWRWVEKNRFESFTKRDCFSALQGTFQKVAKIEEPLNVLTEHNYIQAVTKKTGGRPSIEYNVNPEFITRWS